LRLTQVTPILNVSEIGASIDWFEKLGWQRGFTWNDGGPMYGATADSNGAANFGSVCSGEVEMFLCRDGQGELGTWVSWWLGTPAEVDALHELALRHGMTVTQPPTNEPWGIREFHLRHPDGHTFRVGAPLDEE
jgi:glyoxalase/bleomycin resistance protein/dioxygenase superfamily protein